MYGLGPNVVNEYEVEDFFTKNRLSTTFPVAFLFYIGEEAKGFLPYYVCVKARAVGPRLGFELAQVPVFKGPNAVLPFAASSEGLLVTFEPNLSDLEADVAFFRPEKGVRPPEGSFFEVKLTVVPDSSTISAGESSWGPEIVVRRANFSSAVASALHMLSHKFAQGEVSLDDIKEVQAPLRSPLETLAANTARLKSVVENLLAFLAERGIQRPFLLNPLWWSEVESNSGLVRAVPRLPEKGAFDYLVWSDVAVLAMPLRSSRGGRSVRALLKVALAFKKGTSKLMLKGPLDTSDLAEIVTAANADSQRHTPERQTDKEFSVNGRLVQSFVSEAKVQAGQQLAAECNLFERGRFDRDGVLENVIFRFTPREQVLSYLAPERRLDQAVLFTLTR